MENTNSSHCGLHDVFHFLTASLLVNAEGLAIITVAKVGFLITARGGSGIVIAKLSDGCKYILSNATVSMKQSPHTTNIPVSLQNYMYV